MLIQKSELSEVVEELNGVQREHYGLESFRILLGIARINRLSHEELVKLYETYKGDPYLVVREYDRVARETTNGGEVERSKIIEKMLEEKAGGKY